MLFVFLLTDRPGAGDLRQRVRPQHKEYLARVQERIAFAGPLVHDGDGSAMLGSLLVIDFESREAAMAWLRDEPFTQAGLYASTTVHAFINLWPQKAGLPA